MNLSWMRSGGVIAVVLAGCAVSACAVSQAGAATGHPGARLQAAAAHHATSAHRTVSSQRASGAQRAGSSQQSAARDTAAQAAGRPGVVLVNQPVRRVCTGKTFRVGVWFQRQQSGGSRAYRISVYTPRHKRVFFRRGQAPTAHWAFWRIPAKHAGAYHTVYSAHWRSAGTWTRYRVATTAHRC